MDKAAKVDIKIRRLLVRRCFATILIAIGIAVLSTLCKALQQPPDKPFLIELANPLYPPLAQQASVTGDVEVGLTIKDDGSIESANVIHGHPLLKEAALDSARRSKFECSSCTGSMQYRLVFSFKLEPGADCCTANREIAVLQEPELRSGNVAETHVTLTGERVCICDPGFIVTKRVRSIKCLYLWKCGLSQN